MARSESEAMRSRSGTSAEYGDVYALGMQSAHEVNGWIEEGVEAAGDIVRALEELPPTTVEDGWDVYGPHHDAEADLSWLVKLEGNADGSRFEILVGAGAIEDATSMDMLLSGEVEVGGKLRTGSFVMNFDTVEKYALKAGPDRDRTYRGSMEIRFERAVDSEHKLVDIIHDDFEVTQDYPISDYFAADGYSFRRNADGAGAFHLDITSTFQAQVWSGPERERMTIDLQWNEDGAGVGTAQVLELDGEGDLAYGDITLDECFDEHGYFTWRALSEAYAQAFPGYGAGDASDCVEIDAELPEFRS